MSQALHSLWVELLKGEDLRPWIRRALPELADIIPAGSATPNEIADRLVDAIGTRNLHAPVLRALQAKFPARRTQLLALAAPFGVELPPPEPALPSPAPRVITPWLVVAALVLGIVAWQVIERSNGPAAEPNTEPPAPPQDLRGELARLFQRSPDHLHLNIPALPARDLGTVLARAPDDRHLLATRLHIDESEIVASRSPVVALRVEPSRRLASSLGLAVSDDELAAADIELRLDDLVVREVAGSALRKRIEADPDVTEQRKRGAALTIITRTFEAVPQLAFAPRRSGDAAWQSLYQRLTTARAPEVVHDGPTIVLKGNAGAVLAYELSSVEFVAAQLGDGSDVRLLPVVASDPQDAPAVAPPRTEPLERFAFAVIAGERYRLHGNLPGANGAELVAQTLRRAGGESLVELVPGELTAGDVRRALDQLVERARATRPALLVFYYFGHAMPVGLGQQVLVMGDYTGDLKREVFSAAAVTHQLERPEHPMHGSNLEQLVRVAQAIETELPPQVPGLVTVAEVHHRLEESQIPFVILVDGCYEDKEFESIRELLQLTEFGDYFGTDDGATAEREFHDRLMRYGDVPTLKDDDPVIVAARPGRAAPVVADPRHGWSLSPGVGPLGRRLYLNIDSADSWPALLRTLIDIQPLGEARINGTISWSDLSAFAARLPPQPADAP
ncbi:hypothetical protein [Nannocystis punicea]|uniref:Caspase domain-containing protein n=1 Tax=Nannocystis punicea TaxID=2995304 RepID=A0ABY7GU51_9BACT|nr:hypothetical protein [Nannocystis poenicansa]WAS90443.1 hypothetical protein O0S08_30000 [Nannocystis poenicansa]